ncbi:TonB-dependent receptor domain-containing protein [Pelomonas sp. Root1444]|uniref:TonB-dependent receptor domain-containing protein n=1 Tax=Pelomonas sp. Root1444 TaxID=1736464 RepID=UPI000A821A37|nr:TonB-dependent receptor [Pelomonas sp. Root1444]
MRHLTSRPTAIALALGSLIATAPLAQAQTAQTQVVERVEITGSIIRRSVKDESALPVSSMKAVELDQRLNTELKDMMLELPQASSLGSYAGTAGPMTSLRGFGPMRTLTLLNGRRLAKEPLTNQYVSVNVIPRMAMSYVDILRDGASSSYGSDAMGGVQAFYTLGSYKGVGIKLETVRPERSGGGASRALGLIGGIGDLATDGWNVYAALDKQHRDVLPRSARPELTDGSALTQLGISTAPGLGANATPGNFTDPTHPTAALRTVRYNPMYAGGCLPPYSVPSTSGGRQTCFLDANTQYTAFNNRNDIFNFFTQGKLQLPGDHQLTVEFNHSQYEVDQYNNPAAPTVRLASTHPYYPGNGKVPAVPGLNLAGRPIDVLWSVADAGARIRNDVHTNDRIVLTGEGTIGAWDYRAAVNHGRSQRETQAGDGWLRVSGIASVQGTTSRTLFLDPKLNPFGLQDADGLALLGKASMTGQTLRLHKAENTSIDATFSRSLMKLPGGSMMLALGAELRRDAWKAVGLASNDVSPALNGQIDLLGGDNLASGATSATSTRISRDITSLFAELDVPIRSDLTLNASVRGDKYGDLGETTVNPKLSARWTPVSNLVLRASANTGYRAPSLPEIYTKETERTAMAVFNDPLLCPTVNGVATPKPGYAPEQVCSLTGYTQITKVPNNAGVKPETSRSLTFGVAFEPVKDLTMTLDYWRTQIDSVIGNRAIDYILANPSVYPGLFLRNPDGTLGVTSANGFKDAVVNTPSNVGSMRGAGLDGSLKYSSPRQDWGRVTAGVDIAYLTRWDARSEGVNNGDWVSALGFFNDVVPVNPNAGLSNATRGLNNRWRHTASIAWEGREWLVQLSQRYQSKLYDQNLPAVTGAGTSGPRDVSPYEQFNLLVRYSGFKNLKLSLGVSNLLNDQPPLTNHNAYRGYLTSVADVLGRAYVLTADYRF